MSASRSIYRDFGQLLPAESDEVATERARARQFITDAINDGLFRPTCDSWLSSYSPEFSIELGKRGWIGMTWPTKYGGRAASPLARFAVIEEFLAAGAPLAAHWFADRQIGPGLLRHGTEEQRARYLPPMAAGELYFCIGMSEPEAGSDLASVRTRAKKTDGGWIVNGAKVWTSFAQDAHKMLALVRTGAGDEPAKTALTQMIVDMTTPGITIRPIAMNDGRNDFCEVFFDDVFVPDGEVVGLVGRGWPQVLGELTFERSGPERFLSTLPVLRQTALEVLPTADPTLSAEVGASLARLLAFRAMSSRVNARLAQGDAPGLAAAMVKDLGTGFEGESLDIIRRWAESMPSDEPREQVLAQVSAAELHSPAFTLRGGTTEIMRGIISRQLGVPHV